MPTELRIQFGRRAGGDRLERFGDLPMEDAEAALGQGAVGTGPKLLLDEPEPLAAESLAEDAAVDQSFELLRERLLAGVHGFREQGEIEFGPDRAGVSQDPDGPPG